MPERGGRLLFPAFPRPRALPWALIAISIAALIYGFLTESRDFVILGVVGLAGAVVGFGLARLVIGAGEADDPDAADGPTRDA